MIAAPDFTEIEREAAELAASEADVGELRRVLGYLAATRDPARLFTLLDRLCDPASRDFELSQRTRGYLEAARERIRAHLRPTSTPEEVSAALEHLGWVARLAGYWGAQPRDVPGRPQPPARPVVIARPAPPAEAAPPRPRPPRTGPGERPPRERDERPRGREQRPHERDERPHERLPREEQERPHERPAWMRRGPSGPPPARRPLEPEEAEALAARGARPPRPEPQPPQETTLAAQLRAALARLEAEQRQEPPPPPRMRPKGHFRGSEKALRDQEKLMRRLRGE